MEASATSSASGPPEQLDGADVLLLLLYAPTKARGLEGRVPGITRLEKLLYLVDRETDAPQHATEWFTFEPYDYGPYSKGVYEAVELLEAAGLVREDAVPTQDQLDTAQQRILGVDDPDGIERRFYLTDEGRDVAGLLASQVGPELLNALGRIKDTYGQLPLHRLIRYVYTTYPDSAARSKIRREVMGD